ncbi:MAG: tRNA (guanine-N7)-methyltransferase, partial [Candidatus Sericytochromatia bacterium]
PHGRVRFMYVNFPDPWWKKRHKKRRILQPEYIKLFYDALQLGGIIYVRTDVKEYEEFVLESFAQFDTFEQVEHDIISDGIKSNREVRCMSEGLDLYYLAFKKIK